MSTNEYVSVEEVLNHLEQLKAVVPRLSEEDRQTVYERLQFGDNDVIKEIEAYALTGYILHNMLLKK